MSADLELFATFLIDVRRTEDRHLFNTGRQGDRPSDLSPRTLCRINDLLGLLIEYTMVERL